MNKGWLRSSNSGMRTTIFALLLLPSVLWAKEPTCINSFGRTACGYHCRADAGSVGCAQTEMGICGSSHGKVRCFDPPQPLVQLFGAGLPRPECRTLLGQVACGYGCVSALGQVRCAQTPAGVCAASTVEVQCFDPPWQVYARHGLAVPPPRCVTNVEQIACGYACAGSAQELRCAQTPAGRCQRYDGQVTCWDPPLPIPGISQTGG